MITTQQIAERLIDLCSQGKFETAQQELFAADAMSIEPFVTPDFAKEIKGLDAIIEKGHKFDSMVEEIHSRHMSAPMVAGKSFVSMLTMDITMKGKGRMNMTELCVYETKDGKIISENFFM